MKKHFSYLLLILASTLAGCQHTRQYFPSEMEEVSVTFERFDNALLNVREESVLEDIRVLYDQYPAFMPVFAQDIIGIPVHDTATLAVELIHFLNDTVYGFHATNLREQELFADVKPQEKSLSDAFTRLHYLYPEWEIPSIYLFVSGFNASILFVDDAIAVGADMYLGSNYEFYNRVVNDYQRYTMRPECIPMDVVSAWLFRNIPYTSTKNRLLENMIYRGKIMYLLSVLFPDEKEHEVMGYSEEQWQWCEKYEKAIWNTLMDKRDLFNTEQRIMASYLNDGPFTSEISQESPGRLGTWVGWRIVDSYMRHNQHVTLQQLMEQGDAQMILEESYYKP